MKILVLNCGSSSIKYALYNMDDQSVMTSGGAERVGMDGAFVKVKLANGEKKQIMHDIPEHTEGVKFIFSLLTDPEIGVIKSLDEIDAVGHRMVHGGEKFRGIRNDGYHTSRTTRRGLHTCMHTVASSDGKRCRTRRPEADQASTPSQRLHPSSWQGCATEPNQSTPQRSSAPHQ